jgi:hypothetical protein
VRAECRSDSASNGDGRLSVKEPSPAVSWVSSVVASFGLSLNGTAGKLRGQQNRRHHAFRIGNAETRDVECRPVID